MWSAVGSNAGLAQSSQLLLSNNVARVASWVDPELTLDTCPDYKIPALWLSPAFDPTADHTSGLAIIELFCFGCSVLS